MKIMEFELSKIEMMTMLDAIDSYDPDHDIVAEIASDLRDRIDEALTVMNTNN